jgi:hypothetical protein
MNWLRPAVMVVEHPAWVGVYVIIFVYIGIAGLFIINKTEHYICLMQILCVHKVFYVNKKNSHFSSKMTMA